MKKISIFLITMLFLISCDKEKIYTVNDLDETQITNENVIQIDLPGKQKLYLEKSGNDYILDGDIIFGQTQIDKLLRNSDKGAALSELSKRWPNGSVYFSLASDFQEPQLVYEAIQTIETNVPGLRFYENPNAQNRIQFRHSDIVNNSMLGYQGGVQDINITSYQEMTVIHEIGHAVGILHEQSRSDRDQFLIVHWENIEEGKDHNFQTYLERGFGGIDIGTEMNWESIMLYPWWAFSSNGSPTLTRLDGSVYNRNTTYLSSGDIDTFRTLYPEDTTMTTSISGPTTGENDIYYTWTANTEYGTPPFTYDWKRKAADGTIYIWGSDSSSITKKLPYNEDLHLLLTVTDSAGEQASAEYYVINDSRSPGEEPPTL